MSAEAQGDKPQSFARRDALLQIEERIQKYWDELKLYETDAIDVKEGEKQKYMATFPYPYMNGVLHLGHAFTLAKAEFAVRYQRLRGKRVLFPFGFHCTGMPIAACADKIKGEIAKFGNPPVFPSDEEEVDAKAATAADTKADPAGGAASADAPAPEAAGASKPKVKAKVAKKASKKKYQWQIMEEMGVPASEIANFANAQYWLKYFPPIAMRHLQRFGLCTDWRRSFITTDINPYYDSFVRWQFNTLKTRGKVQFGTRLSIFSPIDDQPCADHDRATGEGVQVQEYTLIKLRLVAPYPKALADLVGSDESAVVLPAATLRPETMYGQTNCFLLPEGDYGVFKMASGEIFVCSARSALNMAYQGFFSVRGQPQQLGSVKGQDLIGSPVKAPLAQYDKVYILPLLTIKMDKGTGVVTSVPSDAPDDWAALFELKRKPQFRAKFGLTDEMVLPYDVVPIIEIPGLGDRAAATLCEEAKIQSQGERKTLDLIKDKVYLEGFHKGIMLVGEHKGQKVADAKPIIRAELIQQGHAAAYAEPESLVMSRSGSECVVAYTDQWFLNYGEEGWKAPVVKHVDETLETFNPLAKKRFQETLDWLHEWGCSRSYGLGTKLPWDPKFVIESLSDSTVYMSFYTVAHLLQPGDLNGERVGPLGIEPAALTDGVWDYIFALSQEVPADSAIAKDKLDLLRKEFLYWYPMDLRVSGKDLIGNHLTMSLYNHAAVWDKQPELWPRGFFTNGHIMVNSEKMSKSLGNFLTLEHCISSFSADATRLALADAGDSLEDANFVSETVNAAILRLTKEEAWIKEMLAELDQMRTGPVTEFFDQVFNNEINEWIHAAQSSYDSLKYHDALKACFFELCTTRDKYRDAISGQLHRDLVVRWIEVFTVLMAPITPHFSEHIWQLLGKKSTVVDAPWPKADPVDPLLARKINYLRFTQSNLRAALSRKRQSAKKPAKGGAKPEEEANAGIIYVATSYPGWQVSVLDILENALETEGKLPDGRFISQALSKVEALAKEKRKMQTAMTFSSFVQTEYKERGREAFERKTPFDEAELLLQHLEFVVRDSPLAQGIEVVAFDLNDEAQLKTLQVTAGTALPGKPSFFFYHKAAAATAPAPSA